MKELSLTEATIKALEGKLLESDRLEWARGLRDDQNTCVVCFFTNLLNDKDQYKMFVIDFPVDKDPDLVIGKRIQGHEIEDWIPETDFPYNARDYVNHYLDDHKGLDEELLEPPTYISYNEIQSLLEGKLLKEDEEDNTPIEGQISFDDVEKEAEEEKKGKYIYETNFRLECPVNDFDEAYNYLTEDDMTQYLDKERCKATPDITSVEWILEDEESGVIRVRAKRELTEDELDELSDWIRGQNSDGLGEGFEQQEFAESYFNPVTGDGPYNRREVEREVERLYEDIDTYTLIENGYLDNEIWEAVENYKDENSNYDDSDEELSDDEIYDIIVSDPDSYLDYDVIEDARQKYADGDDELNENNWYVMASFDWKTNDYKLHRID